MLDFPARTPAVSTYIGFPDESLMLVITMLVMEVASCLSDTLMSFLVLPYRTGTSTAFTTLPETAYLNNLVVQTTPAVITPQNSKNIKIIFITPKKKYSLCDQAIFQKGIY